MRKIFREYSKGCVLLEGKKKVQIAKPPFKNWNQAESNSSEFKCLGKNPKYSSTAFHNSHSPARPVPQCWI